MNSRSVAQNIALTNDEHSMIFCQSYGISFLPKGTGSAPVNDYNLILTCAIQLAFSFIFAMLASFMPFPWSLLCGLCVAAILFFRILTFFLFAWAIVAGRYYKRFYWTSIAFWGWWPFWLLFFSTTAVMFGSHVGSILWRENLDPYLELRRLQMYKDINPAHVPSVRVQDGGIIDFSEDVAVDRGKGGCFLNKGNTYCVAPIVWDGTATPSVHFDMQGMPSTGSYDYFAVGLNCCPCPNKDFQCGDYSNPIAHGGLRSLDAASRPFYQLALDNWQAAYGKASHNPMFFEWVQDPEWKWKEMWNSFVSCGWLAAALALSTGLGLGFILDKVLQVLWLHDIIAPRTTFAPAPYFEFITMLLLPKMFFHYNADQAQIASMPIGASWSPERGPGSAGEDSRLGQQYGGGYGGMGGVGNQLTAGVMNSLITAPGAPSRM
jgi:hypothetical protein